MEIDGNVSLAAPSNTDIASFTVERNINALEHSTAVLDTSCITAIFPSPSWSKAAQLPEVTWALQLYHG